MILFILPNISGRAWVHAGTERMLACKTKPSGWDIRRYCFWWGVWWDSTELDAKFLGYVWLGTNHANRYMLNMHCTCVTTREDPFSKLLVQFQDSHHEATPTNQKCILNSLIEHHFEPGGPPNHECLTCGRRTLATRRVWISCYPIILCIVIGHKMNDETRITLAVNYPVINLNPCTFLDHMKEQWTRNTTSLPQ